MAYLTSNFSSDDKLVEFLRVHMLFTPLWLILVFTVPAQLIFITLFSGGGLYWAHIHNSFNWTCSTIVSRKIMVDLNVMSNSLSSCVNCSTIPGGNILFWSRQIALEYKHTLVLCEGEELLVVVPREVGFGSDVLQIWPMCL